MEALMRKHFDLNGVDYEDTFNPQFARGTWEAMKAACEGMCKEYHDIKTFN